MGRIKSAVFGIAGAVILFFLAQDYLYGEFAATDSLIVFAGVVLLFSPALSYVVRKRSKRWYRILAVAGYCVIAVVVAVMTALSVLMIVSARKDTGPFPRGAAVIVPGCLLHGDKPGEMLKNRLDTAKIYLEENPDAVCVVCGGYIGRHSQAEVMKNYLEQNGVAASRILCDAKSDTTYENLKNAKALLGNKRDIVITTDVYHQYRSKFYARRLGLRPYSMPSKTPLRHYFDSWPRECLAILKAWVTGK